jgi:hypothetical protein
MTALNALATGSEKTQDTSAYFALPPNSSGGLYNFIFRRANIVNRANPENASTAVDIAVNTERRRASFMPPNFVRNIGDLTASHGLEEYDASGFNVVHRFGNIKIGEFAEFCFYRKDRTIEWTAIDLEKQFPPDAIFSGGKWIKGDKTVPKK